MPYKSLRLLYLLCAILLVALTAVLCCYLRPAADDFYYETFFDNGISGFWAMTVEHYRTLTGRVFVHLILCPLLLFDMLPFRVFNALLICALSWLTAALAAEKHTDILPCFASSISLFWLFGIGTLSDAALWGAGSLNYLFPVFLVLLYYYLLHKQLSNGKPFAWLCLPAMLCAATVEMTGLLVPITVLYLFISHWDTAKKQLFPFTLNFFSALAGYLFLFSSSGVAKRLDDTGFYALSLMSRINVNYALFDRMICGPEGIWLIIVFALLSAAYVLPGSLKKAVFLCTGALVILTGTGIVYDGIPLALISLFAFFLLCAYGIWAYRSGERIIPFCILCTVVSLAVCMISPVTGPRMVLPTAVFLSLLCVRGLFWKGFPDRALLLALSGTTLLASCMLVSYITHFRDNAKVIDRNTSLALRSADEEVLSLSAVPDEFYGGSTVPSDAIWPTSFRRHYHLEHVTLDYYDPTAMPIESPEKQLPYSAILRGGQYYIPIRVAHEITGAEVSWKLSCAVVETEDHELYFHSGSRVANLGYGVAPSIKLSDPVRNVNSTIYISLRDYQKLFGSDLAFRISKPDDYGGG